MLGFICACLCTAAIHVYTYEHVYELMCVQAFTGECEHMNMYVLVFVCVGVYLYTHMSIYVCFYLCADGHMHMHASKHVLIYVHLSVCMHRYSHVSHTVYLSAGQVSDS